MLNAVYPPPGNLASSSDDASNDEYEQMRAYGRRLVAAVFCQAFRDLRRIGQADSALAWLQDPKTAELLATLLDTTPEIACQQIEHGIRVAAQTPRRFHLGKGRPQK